MVNGDRKYQMFVIFLVILLFLYLFEEIQQSDADISSKTTEIANLRDAAQKQTRKYWELLKTTSQKDQNRMKINNKLRERISEICIENQRQTLENQKLREKIASLLQKNSSQSFEIMDLKTKQTRLKMDLFRKQLDEKFDEN